MKSTAVLMSFVFGLFISGLVAPAFAVAGQTGDPFSAVSGLQGDALKTQLHQILESTHTTHLDYNGARRAMFGQIYLQQDANGYFVHDVYCGHDFRADETGGMGPGVLPKGDALNTEHTWPQSHFSGDKATQKGDLHHLFPTDKTANADRGNFDFGDVAKDAKTLKCSGAGDHLGTSSSGKGPIFEPPSNQKGNTARALMYFSVRYGLPINAEEEKTIRDWDRQDPVDQAERDANDQIEKLQGNRNPFIDHPEFVSRIQDF